MGDQCHRDASTYDPQFPRSIRPEWSTRGYLPHRDREGLVQHVTFHLADSLPAGTAEHIECCLAALPEGERADARRQHLHEWMDAGHGNCVLRHPEIAQMTQDALLHFHSSRYFLHAWVVMPNHVHVLCETMAGWSLAKVVASWKKHTARQIHEYLRGSGVAQAGGGLGSHGNANLPIGEKAADQEIGVPRRQPAIWHREYWDRYVRHARHYEQVRDYIHANPVVAGLVERPEDWPWSSAGRAPLVDPRPDTDEWV